MINMTYRDIPVITAAGFEKPFWSNVSWFYKTWQAYEDEDTGLLLFEDRGEYLGPMTREDFYETFQRKVTRNAEDLMNA